MKKIIKNSICIFLAVFSSAYSTIAFGQVNTLLNKVRLANSKPTMSYDYRIVLKNLKTKINVDSSLGCLFVKDGQYLDSNNYNLSARVGDYYCKLNYQDRTATICDMASLAKKSAFRLENNEHKYLYNITDFILSKNGNIIIDSSNSHYYRIKVKLFNYEISYAQLDVRRDNHKLIAAYFETEEHENGRHYLTKMYLNNIKDKVDDKIFDLARIYTIKATKPILSKRYLNYTLIPIEQ